MRRTCYKMQIRVIRVIACHRKLHGSDLAKSLIYMGKFTLLYRSIFVKSTLLPSNSIPE